MSGNVWSRLPVISWGLSHLHHSVVACYQDMGHTYTHQVELVSAGDSVSMRGGEMLSGSFEEWTFSPASCFNGLVYNFMLVIVL